MTERVGDPQDHEGAGALDELDQLYRSLLRAERYSELRRHDLAVAELQQALALFPEDADVHAALGVAFWQMEKPVEAEAAFREALRLDPAHARAMRSLGGLLMERGHHAEAERVLIEAIRLEPEEAIGFLFYGQLMRKTDHPEKAEQLLREALRRDPDSSYAHGELALVLAERQRREEARAHGELALALDPEDDWGHLRMGATHYQAGRAFEARRHCREALRLDPDNEQALALYKAADKACRWLYWPVYQYAIWTERLPGKHILVWAIVIFGTRAVRHMEPPIAAIGSLVSMGFLAFVIYTWIAGPLTDAWIRWRPAE
jgi:tetratricopeptide (TPR) repeat protein